MNNNRGLITVDYLFAFFLVSGFSLVILTFSATFSMVEIVQYMAFSSARNYFSSNMTQDKQRAAAYAKFADLKANPAVAPLFKSGWFDVPDNSLLVDNHFENYPEYKDYAPSDPDHNMFHGVVVDFNAKILDFQIPFFGSTVKKDKSGNKESGFITHITAFLGREPSFEECADFTEERWDLIKKLVVDGGAAPYSQAAGETDYVAINDNGC